MENLRKKMAKVVEESIKDADSTTKVLVEKLYKEVVYHFLTETQIFKVMDDEIDSLIKSGLIKETDLSN